MLRYVLVSEVLCMNIAFFLESEPDAAIALTFNNRDVLGAILPIL